MREAGRRLVEAREKAGFSQAELAARLDVSVRSLQKYEAGEREIPFMVIVRMFHLTGTSPTWLTLGPEFATAAGEPFAVSIAVARELYDAWETILATASPAVPVAAKVPLWNVLFEISTKRGSVPHKMVEDAAKDLLRPLQKGAKNV